jgi:hypothetical protein
VRRIHHIRLTGTDHVIDHAASCRANRVTIDERTGASCPECLSTEQPSSTEVYRARARGTAARLGLVMPSRGTRLRRRQPSRSLERRS